jgi:D-3-phosphoglycerate dehydrogenase
MLKILTLNNIPVAGLERFPRDRYEVASEIQHPDALLVRSFDLHGWVVPDTLRAVGRSGVGTDNIPVGELTRRGVPVFNAPGANANAVKELVITGMLLAARNVGPAWSFVRELSGSDEELSSRVESGKKQFRGVELQGKTLGVVGLGAIGVKVANAAYSLGMRVIGYDPNITVSNAWQLSAHTEQARGVDEVLREADFVTLHVPLIDATRNLINADRLSRIKPGCVLLNFARHGIVDDRAVCEAIQQSRVGTYVCDFPNNFLKDHERVIALPHLGASTAESEENCAVMVVDQLRAFLENGEIGNSVNFPDMVMPRDGRCRILVVNSNVPHMIEGITSAIATADINICDLLNKSRGEVACTLMDVECDVSADVIERIRGIEGVLSAYAL